MYGYIDSRDLYEREGFDIRASIMSDDLAPDFYDCYSEAQLEAWRNGEWQFVVLKVSASRRGHELGTAYLGGMEYGTMPVPEGEGYIDCDPLEDSIYLNDLIHDAVTEAKTELRALVSDVLSV